MNLSRIENDLACQHVVLGGSNSLGFWDIHRLLGGKRYIDEKYKLLFFLLYPKVKDNVVIIFVIANLDDINLP